MHSNHSLCTCACRTLVLAAASGHAAAADTAASRSKRTTSSQHTPRKGAGRRRGQACHRDAHTQHTGQPHEGRGTAVAQYSAQASSGYGMGTGLPAGLAQRVLLEGAARPARCLQLAAVVVAWLAAPVGALDDVELAEHAGELGEAGRLLLRVGWVGAGARWRAGGWVCRHTPAERGSARSSCRQLPAAAAPSSCLLSAAPTAAPPLRSP